MKYSYTLKCRSGKWQGLHKRIWGFPTKEDAEKALAKELSWKGLRTSECETSVQLQSLLQAMHK
jgi:hypothetical protein